MASRFWVGGTGTWDNSTTTHWSATTGGAGGASVPGSADSVTFDASSGAGTVTPNYNMTVTSITMGAFTGTLDFSANNNSPTMGFFSNSGTATRTLNMGNGTWSITSNNGTEWNQATITGLTFNANSSTLQFTYAGSATTRTLGMGALTYNNFSITAGSDIIAMTGTPVFLGNFNTTGFTGTFGKSNISMTVTGNFTIGTGSTWTSTGGSITFNTTGTTTITTNGVSLSTTGITISGVGGTFNLGSALTFSGAVAFTLTNGSFSSGNFTMNIPSLSSSNSNTRSFTLGTSTVNVTGNWNFSTITGLTASMASSTLNLSGANLSFTGGSQAYGTVNVTGGGATVLGSASNTYVTFSYTGVGSGDTLTLNQNQTVSGMLTITGNSGVNIVNVKSSVAGTLKIWTFGSASFINCTWSDISLTQNTVGGTWTLNEALNLTGTGDLPAVLIDAGTFNTNNFNITCATFSTAGALTRTINLGSSLISLSGLTNALGITTGGLTLNAGTSTIEFTDTSNSNMSISPANATFWNIYFHRGTSTGSITWNGNSTINNLKDDGTVAHTIILTATQTLKMSSLTVSGTVGNILSIMSSSGGSPAFININHTIVTMDYISFQDIQQVGDSRIYAGANSINVSGNKNIIFSVEPLIKSPFPSFFQMG